MTPSYDELRKINDAYKTPGGSADQKRTRRRAALLKVGIHPATQQKTVPELGTCGDCEHAVRVTHNSRSYWKCDRVEITRGAGTDIRKRWPACALFEEKP